MGALPQRGRRPLRYEPGPGGREHEARDQLPRVAAEEELAKREGALSQVDHGKAPAALLIRATRRQYPSACLPFPPFVSEFTHVAEPVAAVVERVHVRG